MIEMICAVSLAESNEARKLWCPKEVKKLPGHTLVLGASVFFGCCLGISLPYLPLWLGITLSVSFLALVGIIEWRKTAIRKYQHAVNAEHRETAHVRLDETGYHDEKEGSCRCWIGWSGFCNWREGPNTIILGRKLTYLTLPKAALSKEQLNELRTLLKSKIGDAL